MTEPSPEHPHTLLHTRDARGVHTLTLNDPKAFNVLSVALLATAAACQLTCLIPVTDFSELL